MWRSAAYLSRWQPKRVRSENEWLPEFCVGTEYIEISCWSAKLGTSDLCCHCLLLHFRHRLLQTKGLDRCQLLICYQRLFLSDLHFSPLCNIRSTLINIAATPFHKAESDPCCPIQSIKASHCVQNNHSTLRIDLVVSSINFLSENNRQKKSTYQVYTTEYVTILSLRWHPSLTDKCYGHVKYSSGSLKYWLAPGHEIQ